MAVFMNVILSAITFQEKTHSFKSFYCAVITVLLHSLYTLVVTMLSCCTSYTFYFVQNEYQIGDK